jgi:uncharacterized UPF0160 family protein
MKYEEERMGSRSNSRQRDGNTHKRHRKESQQKKRKIIPGDAITHDGNFHLDDVAGAALLKHLGWSVSRISRDLNFSNGSVPAAGTLYFDMGRVYDPSRLMFDHHLNKPPQRKDRVLKSAVTLLWEFFGSEYIHKIFAGQCLTEDETNYIYGRVLRIFNDLDTCGGHKFKSTSNAPLMGSVAAMVSAFVPMENDEDAMDAAFFAAADWFSAFLKAATFNAGERFIRINELVSFLEHNEGWKAGVVILPKYGPFREVLTKVSKNYPTDVESIRYLVHPGSDGKYRTVPFKFKTHERNTFPPNWSATGRNLADLRRITGVKTVNYITPDGRLGMSDDLKGAVMLALNAIKLEDQNKKNREL